MELSTRRDLQKLLKVIKYRLCQRQHQEQRGLPAADKAIHKHLHMLGAESVQRFILILRDRRHAILCSSLMALETQIYILVHESCMTSNMLCLD